MIRPHPVTSQKGSPSSLRALPAQEFWGEALLPKRADELSQTQVLPGLTRSHVKRGDV